MINVKKKFIAVAVFICFSISAQAQESSRGFYWPHSDSVRNDGDIFLDIRDPDSNVIESLPVPQHPMVRISPDGRYALIIDKSARRGKYVVLQVAQGPQRSFDGPTYRTVSISDQGAIMYVIEPNIGDHFDSSDSQPFAGDTVTPDASARNPVGNVTDSIIPVHSITPPAIITNRPVDDYPYQRMIDANREETIAISNNSETQSVMVYVPAQAFPTSLIASGTANVHMSVSIRSMSAYDASLSSTTRALVGDAIEIILTNGDTALATGKTASIRITFRDDDQDGFVDGTRARWNSLKIYRHPGTTGGTWEELMTTADLKPTATTAGWLQASTTRFSIFRLIVPTAGAAPGNLSQFSVYPNPYKPNDGDANNGKPFTATDATSGIIFNNLTNSAVIEVFSMVGERVFKYESNATDGAVQWDTRNRNGQEVTSGYYFYIVRDPSTGERITGKLAIAR